MPQTTSFASTRIRIFGIAIAASLTLGACSETGARARLGEPAADPAIASRQVRYQPVLAGFTGFRPVGPIDWGRSNQRVAPGSPVR
ncbi:hypothetical protein [Phreatobacter stygius]|uniref:Uncharacterized protein n=1 Tax=Phreatobacter stygius TaxID=1940610 RepID=A0A4D7B483_9HYPH|nr:hypothetical protein [Phreatobacter stygius]QCI66035.1 hypothetical protein E8M01_18565 [Phreatobacter stygius]